MRLTSCIVLFAYLCISCGVRIAFTHGLWNWASWEESTSRGSQHAVVRDGHTWTFETHAGTYETLAGRVAQIMQLRFQPNALSELAWVPYGSQPRHGVVRTPHGWVVAWGKSPNMAVFYKDDTEQISPAVADLFWDPGLPDAVLIIRHHLRYLGASLKQGACPDEYGESVWSNYTAIADRDVRTCANVWIPPGELRTHLLVMLQVPPYPSNHRHHESVNLSVFVDVGSRHGCESHGLSVYTDHGDTKDSFRLCECSPLPVRCGFRCLCTMSHRHKCTLYLRIERPYRGQWDIPTKICEITHQWN